MEKLISKKKIKQFRNEIDKCKKEGGQLASDCVEKTSLKYLREVPGMKDMVYPWINYDWSYDTYIDNNYNKKKTGATDAGTFKALFKNPIAMEKILSGFTISSNPNNKSKAGQSDIPNCNGNKGCQLLNSIRKSYLDQKQPYKDPFFNKKLDGEMSSSYFIKTGTCPISNLSKQQCIDKGYDWVSNPLYDNTPSFLRPKHFLPGSCFKSKYSYIKNNSGFDFKIPKNKKNSKTIDTLNNNLKKFKGIIPSFTNDLLSLSPGNIYDVLKGRDNSFITNMKCNESFCNYKKIIGVTNEEYIFIFITIFLFIFFIVIFIHFLFR
jgi:hypothetical protein